MRASSEKCPSTSTNAIRAGSSVRFDQAWFVPFYRVLNVKVVDENTTAEAQVGNTWPYLWTIKPA